MPGALGWWPLKHDIRLSAGQDFMLSLEPRDACGRPLDSFGWTPSIPSIYLDLGTGTKTTWTATVTDALISWRVESALADAVAAGAAVLCRVVYAGTPTTDINWWMGMVIRRDPPT